MPKYTQPYLQLKYEQAQEELDDVSATRMLGKAGIGLGFIGEVGGFLHNLPEIIAFNGLTMIACAGVVFYANKKNDVILQELEDLDTLSLYEKELSE